MKSLIADFPNQLTEGIAIGEAAVFSESGQRIENVVIAGVGGSGIGGTIALDIMRYTAAYPITIVKGYHVPAFVNEHTLVIASSYSGTTEETVHFLKTAIKRGAKIVCITTGGEIGTIATKEKIDWVQIPSGLSPRAGLGYSLVQILFIFNYFGVIGGEFKKELLASVTLLKKEAADIQTTAKKIAEVLAHKTPVIYTPLESEGVAIRFRQQLNENAKMLAWNAVFPEMNHNELVGWAAKDESLAVVIFRNTHEYERISRRIEITKKVISKYTPHVIEIMAKGASFLEQTLYQIHMGDWISLYISEIIGCDPTPVHVVDYLKSEMDDTNKD